MHVVVLGPTGSLGSHICVDLLTRGHEVTGVSRSPEKLGQHERYQPVRLNLGLATVEQLIDVLKGAHTVIWAYHPDMGAGLYKHYLETTRRVLQAVKLVIGGLKAPYFIFIGGTGSLELPNRPFETVLDDREWWLSLQRSIVDSEAHTAYMIERLGGSGPVVESLRAYRGARLAMRNEKATTDDLETIRKTEERILQDENAIPDLPHAARAALMMFEGNQSFKWSFISPSAGYRPGPRTGKYETWFNKLPLQQNDSHNRSGIEPRLLGISVPDLALAVVDETERQQKVGKHWTAVGHLEDDIVRDSHARIEH